MKPFNQFALQEKIKITLYYGDVLPLFTYFYRLEYTNLDKYIGTLTYLEIYLLIY